MRNFFKWIGILVPILVGLLIFFPNLFLRVPEPIRSGTISLPALEESVTVIFDEYAIPHVYAENEHDLFYAAGYVMASERLFQMDIANRAAQGRLAEMDAGLVNVDKYLRTWGFDYMGQRVARVMNPDTRRIVQWACDGINSYIETHRDDLPLEFTLAGHEPLPWDPSIAGGYARLMGHDLISAWGAELAISRILEIFGNEQAKDLFPPYVDLATQVVPPSSASIAALVEALVSVQQEIDKNLGGVGRLRASNNWVISGSRTATGNPLLANDMHLGYSQPPVWYEMHMVGGLFNVWGVCFPGFPLVMSGHNEYIAWGQTNFMTDDADFYLEQVNPEDSSTYLYKGEWVPFKVREETIHAKGEEPMTFEIRETVHGVIINDFDEIAREAGQLVAMRWIGQDISDEPTAFLKLNLAKNWKEFSEAATYFALPGQNMIYADREGNIGWRPFSRIPIRKGGSSLRLLPGATGEWDWEGYVPFEEMPYIYNTQENYIATANHKTVSDAFPYYVTSYWEPPFRLQRITELLDNTDNHTIESSMAIQNDVLSVQAREMVPFLLAAYSDSVSWQDLASQAVEALDLMRQWDFHIDAESVTATVYISWFEKLRDNIYKDEMDQAGDKIYDYYLRTGFSTESIIHLLEKGASPWFDNINTPGIEMADDIVCQAFEEAVKELTNKLGRRTARWQWGQLHTLTHAHTLTGGGALGKFLNWWLDLNVGPFRSSGSSNTVNAINHRASEPFISIWGPSERSIIDLGNFDDSRMVLPTGQSGHPFSRHYDDQAELYNTGEYRTVPFTREAVEKAAYSTLILQP